MHDDKLHEAQIAYDAEGGNPDLANWLIDVSAFIEPGSESEWDEDNSIDVRLRYFDGSFYAYSGDSSYDQDHRGHWGCSSVSANLEHDEALGIAEDLFEQVLDSIAESTGD